MVDTDGSPLSDRLSPLGDRLRRLSRFAYTTVLGPSIFVGSRLSVGSNIFEAEWDLMIILDTCRPDALRAVADEYEFVDDVSERWSVGGDTWEWIANTFDRQYIDDIRTTAYITSNPNARTVLENQLEANHADEPIERPKVRRLKRYGAFDLVSAADFGKYESLFETGLEQGHGAYPSPRSVTNHGIDADRNGDFGRIILHYMPPHWPFLATRDERGDGQRAGSNEDLTILDQPREVSWEAYLDNLRWGLNEVRLVLRNVDRETVVISADHGESFSDWLPPHRSGSINPRVRLVPWVVTEAIDSNTYEPDLERRESSHSPDEIMDALGYTG